MAMEIVIFGVKGEKAEFAIDPLGFPHFRGQKQPIPQFSTFPPLIYFVP
jgi:hypothetical protein